jgi:hypothetical protein
MEIDMQKETKTFETYDLYLASALKISGFRLTDVKTNERGRGLFIFEDRSDRIQCVKSYFSGDLTGSLKAFSNTWADLKNLVEMERG